MERQTRVLLTFGVLILLIGSFYLFSDWFSKATGYVLGEDQKVAFAKCLRGNSSALYVSDNCVECDQQQEILGQGAYAIIPVVKCDSNLCGGLKSVPAWEIEGKFYYGKKTYKELDGLSSCEIK